jgi:hypothetical protein
MKKIFYTLCILPFVFSQLAAAQPSIMWQYSYGGSDSDGGYYINQTYDGGYAFVGSTTSNDGQVPGNHGLTDCWFVKTNAVGTIQWEKELGGSGIDYGLSFEKTTDSGFIIGATSWSTDGQVTGNHGGSDFWIVKLDQTGNIQWQNSYGGSGNERCRYAAQTPDGGYFAFGNTESSDGQVTGFHGLSDYWLIRLDSAGNLLWQKTLGGPGSEFGYFAQQTKDGGFVLAGTTESDTGDITVNHGGYDFWIVKLDSSGNIQWQKSLGGSAEDEASCIRQTQDKGFIVTGGVFSDDGQVSGNHGSLDCWVVKLDSNGNINWQHCFGGTRDDYFSSVSLTSDSGFILAGYSYSNDGQVSGNHGDRDYWVVKLDSSGGLQWQESLGGSQDEWASCIQQTSDDGYILTGYSSSSDGQVTLNRGWTDIWTVKLSSTNGIPEAINPWTINLYPSPASDKLVVDMLVGSPKLDLSILNLQGHQVLNRKLWDAKNIIDISPFPSGVYNVKITGEKTQLVKKFIKL